KRSATCRGNRFCLRPLIYLSHMLQSPRPTVYIETYGCQMNVSDTELMLGKLTESGYESVEQPEGADVILINTCAIRDHAEQRVAPNEVASLPKSFVKLNR